MDTYTCTKRYPEICVAHRNWNSGTHCARIHGYARTVEITIVARNLDEKQWVMDLGNLRFIKEVLTREWDHRLLVSDDDPLLADFHHLAGKGALDLNILPRAKGWGPGLEASCRHLYDLIAPGVRKASEGRCVVSKIEIWEKTDNRAALVIEHPFD